MTFDKTYCNPIPLPDYPIGRSCYIKKVKEDFRETADPTVIYENGRWYLYPSCGMVYWTDDFINWNHLKMEPYDAGYAPTVVKHNGKFYLTACSSDLFVSDSPVGPFKSIGPFICPNGEELRADDPMLFSDTDGSIYLYYGCGGGITGVQLDSANPAILLTDPVSMFEMDTVNHEWERIGDWNEDGSYSWTEGSWMYKRGDTYYLTYSAPGTEWVTYAMGAYKSKSPLGPWEYMKTSPFLSKKTGLVRGPGHGSIVEGPNNTLWAFYTCTVCYASEFERRIGFDPIGFDDNGDIIPTGSSEIPQWVPGVVDKPWLGNDAGIIPLTQHRRCSATSNAPGRDPLYAIDDSMLSWWQPDKNDKNPSMTVVLSEKGLNIASVRIMWRDVGLDIKKGIMPGPFRYTVDAKDIDGNWVCVLDCSKNDKDLLIDYRTVKEMKATEVRLNITGSPEGIEGGVINFTVFGMWKNN